jgi:hypothetical protein
MMNFLIRRLNTLREGAIRYLVPFPDVIDKPYWPVITAFPSSFSVGRNLLDIVSALDLSPRSARILIIGPWGGRDYFWLLAHGYVPETLDIVNHPWGETTYLGDVSDSSTWERVKGPFDFIIMRDVLEHLQNDFQALCHIASGLKATGHLWLSVPYCHEEEPTHLRAYSPITLRRLLSSAGFDIIGTTPRPGILEAFPRIVNCLNYALALSMPTARMGAKCMVKTLHAEQRLNNRMKWLGTLVGGMQTGLTCLCARTHGEDVLKANRDRFGLVANMKNE